MVVDTLLSVDWVVDDFTNFLALILNKYTYLEIKGVHFCQ